MDIVVKETKGKGKGVFAARDFKKGEIVLIWHPKAKLSLEEMRKLPEDEQIHTTYVGNGMYYVMGEPDRYVNHSCDPNTYVNDDKDIALRDIKEGEEITSDYAVNSIDDWEMECKCGMTTSIGGRELMCVGRTWIRYSVW